MRLEMTIQVSRKYKDYHEDAPLKGGPLAWFGSRGLGVTADERMLAIVMNVSTNDSTNNLPTSGDVVGVARGDALAKVDGEAFASKDDIRHFVTINRKSTVRHSHGDSLDILGTLVW